MMVMVIIIIDDDRLLIVSPDEQNEFFDLIENQRTDVENFYEGAAH